MATANPSHTPAEVERVLEACCWGQAVRGGHRSRSVTTAAAASTASTANACFGTRIPAPIITFARRLGPVPRAPSPALSAASPRAGSLFAVLVGVILRQGPRPHGGIRPPRALRRSPGAAVIPARVAHVTRSRRHRRRQRTRRVTPSSRGTAVFAVDYATAAAAAAVETVAGLLSLVLETIVSLVRSRRHRARWGEHWIRRAANVWGALAQHLLLEGEAGPVPRETLLHFILSTARIAWETFKTRGNRAGSVAFVPVVA